MIVVPVICGLIALGIGWSQGSFIAGLGYAILAAIFSEVALILFFICVLSGTKSKDEA